MPHGLGETEDKRMKKRIVSLLLALVIVTSLLPVQAWGAYSCLTDNHILLVPESGIQEISDGIYEACCGLCGSTFLIAKTMLNGFGYLYEMDEAYLDELDVNLSISPGYKLLTGVWYLSDSTPSSSTAVVQPVPANAVLSCGDDGSIIPDNCYVDYNGTYYIQDSSGTISINTGNGTISAREAVVFNGNNASTAEVVLSTHVLLLANKNVAYKKANGDTVTTGINRYRCYFCGRSFYGSNYDYSTPETAISYDKNYAMQLIKAGYVTLATEDITLQWEQKGWLLKKDDKTKPPYPNGTDAEYAEALLAWTEIPANVAYYWTADQTQDSSAKLNNCITASNAKALLDQTVYLPVDTTGRGDYLLLDDGTTVRQAIMDIVFLENLQSYVAELDEDIENVTFGVGTEKSFAGYSMKQEKAIYRKALSWNAQIQKYLDKRDPNTNLYIAPSAALAYIALDILANSVEDGTFKTYIKPFVTAVLQTNESRVSIESLRDQAYYSSYKKLVESTAKDALKKAKTYTVTTDCGGYASLSYDIAKTVLANSGNATLEEISKTCSQFDSTYDAVQVSMFLGSTIGMFPMVVDLYNDMHKSAAEEVRAMYFLADYYIEREYPEVYNTLFNDGSGYPVAYNYMQVLSDTDLQQSMWGEGHKNDPIMYNWLWMWQYREKQWRNDCAGLRADLTNYALLLRFARDFDVEAAKRALVEYLEAEINSKGMATGSFKCPVTLELYDLNHELVASLSSESESIPQVSGATLYLLGESNEEKYVVFDPAQYTLEVKPYDSGTMDVVISDGDGNIWAYQDVPVAVDMDISVAPLADEKLTVTDKDGSRSISPSESVPVRNVTIGGLSTMKTGTTQQLAVTAYPASSTAGSLTWSSSCPEIATVDDVGTVTALKAGSAVITVQEASTGNTADFTVYVTADIQSIVFSDESITLTTGEEQTLQLTLQPETAALCDVRWRSSDPDIAMVDSSGTLYGINAGETTIAAYVGDVETLIQVTILERIYDTGDINGDGTVSVLDVACLYDLLISGWYDGKIDDISQAITLANINGDENVDVYDLQRLYEAVSGINPF